MFLVHRVPAWSRNLSQRLVKAPKVHLVDSGLACHLLGADAGWLSEDRPLMGRLLESYVVGELRKQTSWTDSRTVLRHFRTAPGSEVDVIIEKPDGSIVAIEVKASATVAAPDFEAMGALRDKLGRQFRAGVVLYLGAQVEPFGDKLRVAPVPALRAP